MAISFNTIPGNLREPFIAVEFDSSRARTGPGLMAFKLLVIGLRRSVGTVAALQLTRITSAAQAVQAYGAGSMLAQMLDKHLQNNDTGETWAIALDELSEGVAATGAITYAGSPTAAGLVNLMVAGHRLRIGAVQGATAAQLATATAAAINAEAGFPCTAAVDGSNTAKVNLTARHKGESGNSLDLRLNYYDGETTAAGLTVTLTAFSSGTGNPDLDAVWDIMGDTQYHMITCGFTDAASLTALEAELASRFGPLRQIDGVAVTAAAANHAGLGALGDSRNSPHLVITGGYRFPNPPWEIAAATAARIGFRAQIDPARPHKGQPLLGILPPAREDRWNYADRNLLTYDGITTLTVDDGGIVRLSLPITTYKTNAVGGADDSYLQVRTMTNLMYLRWDWRNLWSAYMDYKLAQDGTAYGAGQAVMTPKTGKAINYAWFRRMEALGLVEDFDQFVRDHICEIDATNPNRLNNYLPPNLINGLDVIAAQIGFRS